MCVHRIQPKIGGGPVKIQPTRWLLQFMRRAANSTTGKAILGRLVGWGVTYMSFAIPLKRLRETEVLLAFFHPQPVYPLHILLVPKRPVPSLGQMDASDTALLHDLVKITQSLVQEYDLEDHGYRLIVNGGPNQEFPHLHFHLISDHSPSDS